MTQEEYKEIIELLDDRYVAREICAEKQEKVNAKFANDDKRIDIMVNNFGIFEKLLSIIATAAIGGLVTAVLNLILK